MDANRWIDLKLHKSLEFFFFVGSLAWTVYSFITFILVFKGSCTLQEYSAVNTFYWPTVLLYASARKLTRALAPGEIPHRKTELIMVFWMFVGLVAMGITLMNRRDMMPLMQELGVLYLILLGILIGGKALEKMAEAVFGKR